MESHHFHWWNGGIPSDPKQIKSNTIAIGSQVQGGQVQMHWLVHHYLIPCHGLWRALVVEQGSVAPHQADGQVVQDNHWKSLLVVVPSSSPVCLARALPNFLEAVNLSIDDIGESKPIQKIKCMVGNSSLRALLNHLGEQ